MRLNPGWGRGGGSQVIVDILAERIPVLLVVLFRHVRTNLNIQQPAVACSVLGVFFCYFSGRLYRICKVETCKRILVKAGVD